MSLDAKAAFDKMFRTDKVLIWSKKHAGYYKNPEDKSLCSKKLCNAGLVERRVAKDICEHSTDDRIIEIEDAFTSLQLEVRMKINQ